MLKFVLGLVVVAFAVGGIEDSFSDTDLVISCLVAAMGLMLMHAGTQDIKEQ